MAGHWISANAQVRSLAKAVSAAFAASSLTEEEKWPGRIEITDLPWQLPPLECSAMLGGAPLSDYLNVPMRLEEKRLFQFWTRSLEDMWHRPSVALKRGLYAHCGWAFPQLKMGHRALLFSQPMGYPALLEPIAGAQFTVELVHAIVASMPVRLVSTANDYFVDVPGLPRIGIQGGRLALETPWTMNVSGMLPDLLEMPRGAIDYRCQFDPIAQVRSVLHVHRKMFPREFEGLDYALQALRFLSLGGACPELVTAMHMPPVDKARMTRREEILRDAIEALDAPITDRDRLNIWHALLVPEVLSPSGFKRDIFYGQQFPYALAQSKLAAIRAFLEGEYAKLPQSIKKIETKEAVC